MVSKMIPQYRTYLDEKEIEGLIDVIKSGWVGEGEKTKLFEEKIIDLIKTKYAISVSNGTIALFIALKALGIKINDEVILPDLTFIASANSILMAGAKHVFVDVDKDSFNIDPSLIEEKITDKTKAIMTVHLYGKPAEMEKINKIAKKNNIFVIEDAAEAFGAKYNDKPVGSLGDISCFSFFANKNITTGEGGMITTNDDKLAKKCRIIKDQGRTKKGSHVHPYFGFNARFTDLQAAIGLAQLSKFNKILKIKKEHQALYESLLPNIEFPLKKNGEVIWFTNILVDNPEGLQKFLFKNSIEARRFFIPLHKQPFYSLKGNFPNSDYLYDHGLSLPSYVLLKNEEIEYICKKINEFYLK